MRYNNIKEATFVNRPNRFIAEVEIEGKNELVHVKNTGRLKELLISGVRVLVEEENNPARKTKYSLIAVYKGNELVNIDSQAPNLAAYEAIKNGIIKEIGKPDIIKREVKFDKSRFDIYYEKGHIKGFVEVKGVTLDDNGCAMFPDAPTQRGTKHIMELIKAHDEGYESTILFVIQMKNINSFKPNYKRDPEFAKMLLTAKSCGVNILAYDCIISENKMIIDNKVNVFI